MSKVINILSYMPLPSIDELLKTVTPVVKRDNAPLNINYDKHYYLNYSRKRKKGKFKKL